MITAGEERAPLKYPGSEILSSEGSYRGVDIERIKWYDFLAGGLHGHGEEEKDVGIGDG